MNFNNKIFIAIVYRFNVSITKDLQEEADKKEIPIRPYNVIYKLVDDIRKEINNRLPLIDDEEVIGIGEVMEEEMNRRRKFIFIVRLFPVGEANILQEFVITEKKKKVKVAGCRCVKGNLRKTAMYRLIRGQETLYTGKEQRSIENCKRVKQY